jgi:hypothetical protein
MRPVLDKHASCSTICAGEEGLVFSIPRTWITWLLRGSLYVIPFSSDFRKCSRQDFRDAATELFVTTFFTTMPLWIMPLLGPVIFKTEASFTDQLLSTIKGGELFVYCAALVGPLIYIIAKRYGEIKNEDKFSVVIAFPHGLLFVLFSALLCVIAGFAFSLMKNPVLESHQDVIQLNFSGIFWASVCAYVFSLYCFFCASVYRNAMADFVAGIREEEDSFAIEWETRSNAEPA